MPSKKIKQSGLVVNDETSTEPSLQEVTMNLGGAKTRHATLEGQKYLVVPMVMLTEGVHAGSKGPLYYPKNELSKTPMTWDHKPIVVYHPTMNGQAISACRPEVIERSKVGLILNTRYDEKKNRLTSEAWIQTNKLSKVDPRVMRAIEGGKMVEVSTGLFTDNTKEEGEWNGERYTYIAKNYRPDHLAILPDQKGACSIKDGAGLLRNSQSYGELHQALSTLVQSKYGTGNISGAVGNGEYAYVQDVFPDFCVFSKGGKSFKHDYTVDGDGNPELSGKPEVVTRKMKYAKSDGTILNSEGDPDMKSKKKLVDALIGNASTSWTDEDRKFLTGLDTDKLEKMLPVADEDVLANDGGDGDEEGDEDEGGEEEEEERAPVVRNKSKKKSKVAQGGDDDGDEDEAPARNAAEPPSFEEFVNNAPSEYRDMIVEGLNTQRAEKKKLVDSILGNKANGFSKSDLGEMTMNQLKKIAALASTPAKKKQPVFNFNGDAGDEEADVTSNSGAGVVLPVPRMTFKRE